MSRLIAVLLMGASFAALMPAQDSLLIGILGRRNIETEVDRKAFEFRLIEHKFGLTGAIDSTKAWQIGSRAYYNKHAFLSVIDARSDVRRHEFSLSTGTGLDWTFGRLEIEPAISLVDRLKTSTIGYNANLGVYMELGHSFLWHSSFVKSRAAGPQVYQVSTGVDYVFHFKR